MNTRGLILLVGFAAFLPLEMRGVCAPGSLDATFEVEDPVTTVGGPTDVSTIALQADGKVLVANRGRIFRLDETGVPDSLFREVPVETVDGGAVAVGQVHAILPRQDGRILVVGYFNRVAGASYYATALLKSDGSVDNLFSGGTWVGQSVWSAALLPNGGFLEAGEGGVRARKSDGGIDPTFLVAAGIDSGVELVTVAPNGKAYIAGAFQTVSGRYGTYGVARLFPDGTLDPGFRAPFKERTTLRCLRAAPDGRVMIGGSFELNGKSLLVAALSDTGALDRCFTPFERRSELETVESIAVEPDGHVLVAGSFVDVLGQSRRGLVRLFPDGTLDPTFHSPLIEGRRLTASAEGSATVLGWLPAPGGTNSFSLYRFLGGDTPGLGKLELSGLCWVNSDLLWLLLKGDPGQSYTVERSFDLSRWQVWTNSVTTRSATVIFGEPPRPPSYWFYRLRIDP